jgi:hypothetical protein
VLGYDMTATDTLDGSFGETNIIGTPWNNGLDVRITNEWNNRFYLSSPGTWHTKKQIEKNNCGSWFTVNGIDIKTNHWPVIVTWDSALFNDICRNGSVFTGIPPGGWWDVGCPSSLYRAELFHEDAETFTTNITSGGVNTNYAYINSSGDTISMFWQIFADSTLLTASIQEVGTEDQLKVFPDPASDHLNIELPATFGKKYSVQLISSLGQIISTETDAEIDLQFLPSGVYFVLVTNEKGERLRAKVLKEQIF